MQKKFLHPNEADALEKALLLHNHDDIAGMLNVCGMLCFRDIFSLTDVTIINIEETPLDLKITFQLPQPVPRPVTLYHNWDESFLPVNKNACLTLDADIGILTLPLIQTCLKLFFSDYKNYFYLPSEDCAMHKSVAQFVDAAFRQKATASTCYTKKEGTFFPCLSPKALSNKEPLFYREYKEKTAFFLLDTSDKEKLQQQIQIYLLQELSYF